MLRLNNTELINISIIDAENGVRALKYSSKNIEFGRKVIYTHYKPDNITDDIEYIEIDQLTPQTIDYFAIKILPHYQICDFMISIHTDGFIINPHLWNPDFQNYDYIAAPWPPLHWCRRNRVGNGGFVMKSKKFTEIESTLSNIFGHNDVLITNFYYDVFIQQGCKYAPVDLAKTFALELPIPECKHDLTKTFGFHGKYTPESIQQLELLKQYT